MLELYVFTFHQDGRIYRALSLLTPEQVQEVGLVTEAVLGDVEALLPSMTPEQFTQNEAFVTLLHEVVREVAPQLPALQAEAKAQGTGQVVLADERVQGQTAVAEDVLGSFAVVRGELLPERYTPNPHYRLLTDRGVISLPPLLEQELLVRVNTAVVTHKHKENPHE
jgi:hypothetical protein